MLKKLFNFNLFLLLVFVLTTVFPPPLFSYEAMPYHADTKYQDDGRVDESLDYSPVIFKKARCPRCGMELYYVPGKEGPHSHWVHYEIPEDRLEKTAKISRREEKRKMETEKKKSTLGFFSKKEDVIDEIEKRLSEEKEKEKRLLESEGFLPKRYELRQQLVCPYDGYMFFPEGDIIEETKLMQRPFRETEPSVIESNFSKSIPFGISKDLSQFGYDLFIGPEEEKEKEEKAAAPEEAGSTFSALGMLRAAFTPETESSKLSFQAASRTAVIPVGPDYIVGPGDTLVINIWGSVQESFPVEIDREGKIMLPKAGPLYVWGLKLKEAEGRIKERLNQYYTNFYMDLSMGKLRDIPVDIMGEVKKPGSYLISSQSSIFQALYAASGPTKLGSLRKIRLIHTDGTDEEIDLYPFLLEGKMIRPCRIQSGDTVFVPSIGDVVAVAGNVKRPAIYETKSEISLVDLLNFSGGITPTGDLQRLQVERIQNNERRVMVDIELQRTELGKFSLEDINLQNGDLVIVSPIVRLKHDFVSILGNVERPGDYALIKGMKLSDLIKRSKGFLPGTYLQRAEIARVSRDRTREIIPVNLDAMMLGAEGEDVLLEEWDILLVYSEAEVKPPSFVEIDGAVARPGKYELTPGMKISDLIFKAGSISLNKVVRGAELFHIIPGEQPVVREIGIKQVSDLEISVDKDIILRAGDALFVKSEPKLTERRVVIVKGEVRYPGTYSIREGETLSSLVERAGGFTREAFLDGAVFNRKSIKEAQEKMRRDFLERENRAMLAEQQSILLRRSDSSVSAGTVSESLKIRKELIDFIASAEIEGRMVIKLQPLAQLKGTKYDILLEDGDTLIVPLTPSAITVIGSVNNPTSVPYEEGKGIEYYIYKTGGLTKHADKNGIYVLKANGEATSKFMMSKRIDRGDTIVVPQEFKYWTPPGQLLRDTVDILSRIAIGVGVIAALQ
jgi:protein involved in polysaccharide export with SLBB domain